MELAQKITAFNDHYTVQIDSLATQSFSLNELGGACYGIPDVYGATTVLYLNRHCASFSHIIEKNHLNEKEEYLKLVELFASVDFDTDTFEKTLIEQSY